MAAAHADVVAFTQRYIEACLATNVLYDCTRAAEYARFKTDVAQKMSREHAVSVSALDVEQAIAETVLLRSHPMLQRARTFDAEPALAYDSRASFGSSASASSSGVLRGAMRAVASWFQPTSSAELPLLGTGRHATSEQLAQHEWARVYKELSSAVEHGLRSGAFVRFSNEANDQWYLVVKVDYLVDAAYTVGQAVRRMWTHERARRQPRQPYLESYYEYNRVIGQAGEYTMAMFFFRWYVDPRHFIVHGVSSDTGSNESSPSSSSSLL
jgi:hypothetical protein